MRMQEALDAHYTAANFAKRFPGCWVPIISAEADLVDTLDRVDDPDNLPPGEWVIVRDADGDVAGVLDDTLELEELTNCHCCGRDLMPAGWTHSIVNITRSRA